MSRLYNGFPMNLCDALRLHSGEVVAFVGGGGKTTAMFRLAYELATSGQRVITTTTTHLGASQTARAPFHLVTPNVDRPTLLASLAAHHHILITGPIDPALGKATGVPETVIEDWLTIPDLAAILVEADGSRQRPFKAPTEHEPAIPACAALVIIVVGLEALGQPLTAEFTHRPEQIAALAQVQVGDPVTPELIAQVIAHPQGGLKNVPPAARVCVLLNQADTVERRSAAYIIAEHLRSNPRFEAVLIGALAKADPVSEVWDQSGQRT